MRRETKSDRQKKTGKRWLAWAAAAAVLLLFLAWAFKFGRHYPFDINVEDHKPGYFGVTFSTKFCQEMGLDWREVFQASLDDLQVKHVRLPIYWDEIEKEEGKFDFSTYDYIIAEGAKRDVKFIANIGWRLPRWPECHAPEWAGHKSLAATQARAVNMVKAVVDHYKDEPSIVAWQLENEPFFNAFGICPPSDDWFFSQELEALKKLDSRPVIISATGELSTWRKEAKLADIFGTTVYRVVWGPIGYVRYPIPAWLYRFKAWLAGIPKDQRLIIELQTEPWVPSGSIIYLPEEEANKSFNVEQFEANLQYAINIDFKQAYLWGVEWWYWQYQNGNPEYWQIARRIFD